MTTTVATFRQLRKLKVSLKPDDSVQIQRAGGYFKARFRGAANCVIASTAHEARQRLLQTPSMRDTPNNLKRREHNWVTGFREGK